LCLHTTDSDFDGSGCGVNVTNKDPTVCINDIISHCRVNDEVESMTGEPASEQFTVEEVIARSVTVLEHLIQQFENDRHKVLEQYYKYWLHR